MEYHTSLKRLVTLLPERYEVSETYPAHINAVEVSLVDGNATDIKRINIIVDNKNGMEVSVDTSV